MARRKKSGSSAAIGALLVGLFILLATIPREAWIVIGGIAILGIAFYVIGKSKSNGDDAAPTALPESRPEPAPRSKPEWRPPRPTASRGQSQRLLDDEPVAVQRSSSGTPSSYAIPKAPSGYSNAKWVPAGQITTVAGVQIPGGLIYVGTSLTTPYGDNDPCLIDPSKSVAKQGDYTVRELGYWPSYSAIPASARRAYLNWLADGRKDPEADIGYVFIFFYGLERRAIVDAASDPVAKDDWPIITAELRRLLEIYGDKSGSFRGYAGSLLDLVSLSEHPEKAYLKPVPSFPKTYELPLYIRVALGQAAVDGAPVPALLALAWATLNPETYLRTPATRCADEFDKLFTKKYEEAFGQGMVLPKNRTKIKLVYRPASAGFRGYGEISLNFGDTPDVTVLTAPIKKLAAVVEAATEELGSFSRYVGKNPEARHALDGLLLLPATLWPDKAQKTLLGLKERMGDGLVAISFQELLSSLDAKAALTKDKTLALARALESLNIGIEPDVLGGAKPPKPEEKVVLFAVPAGEQAHSRASPAYQAAALTLQLASAVATADGEFGIKEMSFLRTQVQSWTHLTPAHIRRLLAHLRLLILAPASLTALKKKLEPLDASAKETIAAFMATVAQSDGTVSSTEVKFLEKVYKALGVEPKKVFSDVHAVAAAAQPAAAPAKAEDVGFKLDPARIAALQKDTEAVSALLANIFQEDDTGTVPVAAASAEAADDEQAAEPAHEGLLGLDEAHSALARLLLSRPEWSKEEIGDAAADLDLMVEGALEALNEAAFDKHDVPFVEGDDPVTVNPELLEKIEA